MLRDSSSVLRSSSFTGHRPARFAFGYNESDERCVKIKAVLAEQIGLLVDSGVTVFYSGMALAVDTWCAEIVLQIKKVHTHIQLIAVRPCETQADSWSSEQQTRHFDILARCDDVITLYPKYTRSCFFERNRYLVDHAEYLLAVYDGTPKGGTAYTVKYGKQQRRQITVIHPDTLDITTMHHSK